MTESTLFSKIKEAGVHTVIYGLGSVLQTMLNYILIPLYTRYYTPETYGVLSLLMLCGTLAGSVFYLGASSALSRSYYDYNDDHKRKLVVSTAFYITLMGAALQVLLGILLSSSISMFLFGTTNYSMHIVMVLITSALAFLSNLFYVLLRFERKSKQVVLISILSLVLTSVLIIYFLVYLGLGVLAPIWGGLIGQVILLATLFLICRKHVVLDYSRREIALQLEYGLPQILIGFGFYTLDYLDRFLINIYGSLNDVGIYSLGYKLGVFIHSLFIVPFGQIWAPMRMEYRHDKDAKELHKLILTYYFLTGLFITTVVSIFSKELLTFIAEREEYFVAYRIVPFVMLAHLIYGVVNIIDSGIAFERKVMYHVYIFWFCVLINLMLNYLLIPEFGYIAAAYTTLASYVILALLVSIVSSRLYKIHLEGMRLLKVFGAGALVSVLGNLISFDNLILVLSMKTFLAVALIVFLGIFVLTKEERSKVYGLFMETSRAIVKQVSFSNGR